MALARFRIAIIGDMHVGFDERSTASAARALADTRVVAPDVLLLAGDLVEQHARHWPTFGEILRGAVEAPLLASRGNADVVAGSTPEWLPTLAGDGRSVFDLEGWRFLTLGAASAEHEMEVGPAPAEWLTARCQERPEADVVILSHAPLRDTTYWSCRNAEDACLAEFLSPDNPPFHLYLAESEAIGQALAALPNVRLFLSGHVHHDGRMLCKHGYGSCCLREGVLHLSAPNVGGWVGIGGERTEYLVVDVEGHAVTVRVRDFAAGAWADERERGYPRWPSRTCG